MTTYNIHDAKTHFSKLIESAAKGEVVVIAKAGKPVAKLTSISEPAKKKPRRLGLFEGKYHIPDDFDAPLPDDVLAEFYRPLLPEGGEPGPE